MPRHRSFSSELKRQIAKEFLDGRAGLHELARRHSLSRNLIRLWLRKYEAGEFTDEVAEAVHVAEYERKIAEQRCALPRCEEISRHYRELITSSQATPRNLKLTNLFKSLLITASSATVRVGTVYAV